MRQLGGKAAVAKSEGDRFLDNYFLARRTTYSTVEAELDGSASASGITLRDHAYNAEPIEGSDDLSMLTITANFEGTYDQLIHLVNRIDRSALLMIVDSLQATPQQGSQKLLVNMKLNAFVREGDSAKPVEHAPEPAAIPAAAPVTAPASRPTEVPVSISTAVPAGPPIASPNGARTATPVTLPITGLLSGSGARLAMPTTGPVLPAAAPGLGPRVRKGSEAR
jgi:hypothetical protein